MFGDGYMEEELGWISANSRFCGFNGNPPRYQSDDIHGERDASLCLRGIRWPTTVDPQNVTNLMQVSNRIPPWLSVQQFWLDNKC